MVLLIGSRVLFGVIKEVLELDSGNGCMHNIVHVINATKLHTKNG